MKKGGGWRKKGKGNSKKKKYRKGMKERRMRNRNEKGRGGVASFEKCNKEPANKENPFIGHVICAHSWYFSFYFFVLKFCEFFE